MENKKVKKTQTSSVQSGRRHKISLWAALLPIVALLGCLVTIIAVDGPDAIAGYSPYALLGAATLAVIVAASAGTLSLRGIKLGLARSARQILPAVPMLFCIAVVATTWMVSGVVPTLICYGLAWLNPTFFLVSTCLICAVVSVLTGSSWSTIATIGVAFMGIGTVMGYNAGWIAGAIISGAYFGDKVSPLSDTTVLAASVTDTPLFRHIRYMMITTIPSLVITLVIFTVMGFACETSGTEQIAEFTASLNARFHITPWLLIVPVVTGILIARKVPSIITLFLSTLLAATFAIIFQPELLHEISGNNDLFEGTMMSLYGSTSLQSDSAMLTELIATRGMAGMMNTIWLIICAMCFGGAMTASGMLGSITSVFVRFMKNTVSVVASTVGSGIFLNLATADQYISIILTGNMFSNIYEKKGYESRLLSRTTEDAVTVTSALIPWNTCGMTQATILSVPTLTYLPYCFFNLISPLMSILVAAIGYKIVRRK